MRSDLIHDALTKVHNRYVLCQVASKATRKFHRPNTRVQDTMNEVLHRFSKAEGSQQIVERNAQKETVADANRPAA